jgi:putative peptidoglycan lipid II flippase
MSKTLGYSRVLLSEFHIDSKFMSQSRALSNRQIARAAGVVLVGFLASGVLGLVRTAIISATFGTSAALDAFLTAQRIPEALFVLVAGGALGSSFIPVFAQYLTTDDKEQAWRLASSVMTLSALAAAALGVLVVIAAPVIVPVLLTSGSPPEVQALTVELTRLMMLTPVIFSISGLLMGILNAHQIFLLPALAISMNSIGLIVGAVVIARLLPPGPDVAQSGSANVYGLALGAVLSALLHLVVQLPGLRQIRPRLRFLADWRVPGTLKVLRLMGPRVLGLAVTQINFIVNASFASHMVAGSYTALTIAWTLMFFVLGVIAQSVGTAVFPSLSALAAEGDMVGFRERLAGAMRGVLFLALPATIGLMVLGGPVIALIFQRDEWTAESTAATNWALLFFALGIAGHSLLEVLSRAFYALSDTRTPVAIGLASMVSNIALSVVLIQIMGDPNSLARGPFAGLALANSATTLLEGVALWWLMRRRIGGVNDAYVIDGVWRVTLAALGMGAAVWLVTTLLQDAGTLMMVLVGMAVGGVTFLGLTLALRVDEARTLPRMILGRVRR